MDVQGGTPRSIGPGLYEFLMEAELQHYYTEIKGDLKVQTTAQLKYVAEEDLNAIGMSKPEMRRLKKYFQKHFPQNYLSKFKKMLLPKRDEQSSGMLGIFSDAKQDKPSIKVPNKHMIPTDAIIVNKELGVGEFGVVQQGVWTNDGERIQVAIKSLSRERMQNNPIEFLKEAAIMHSIDHENIVRLYGVVLDTNSLMLVTELAPLRSLLECLKEPSLRVSFPVLSLCDFTTQIANGMQYLEAKRLIHRDLAARNILVFSKNKVKISDFGLSRALGVGKDYYQTNFNVNLKLPIAWCAPESISYLKFTSSSDVWAFGVTLWEMFSYGFQPWAALTGHQILEAIDEPNFQRLEQPDCCPKDYFGVMEQCWQHEPGKRPKFSELIQLLPDLKPEQVQAVQDNVEIGLLTYHQGDIITVLDKGINNIFWKGVLSNGKTGYFNPAYTITYLGSNLPSNKPGEFTRGDGKNIFSSQRKKIRMDMISSPQGDLKHTGHVGLDGAYFGDISFLGGKYPHVPRQIVTPYKPQEDITDQSIQYLKQDPSNSKILCEVSSADSNVHSSQHIHFDHETSWPDISSMISCVEVINESTKPNTIHEMMGIGNNTSTDHEYHEISDEEIQSNVLRFDKPLDFDFGPSLLDEMDQMFRSLGTSSSSLPPGRTSADHESSNMRNEIKEIQAKQGNNKKQASVKPISAADQRTLYSAIAMAQELTARSMTDLEYSTELPPAPTSPLRRRKFSFKLSHQNSPKVDRRYFSEEAAGIPDIQATLSDEAKEVYNSLVETQIIDSTRETNPLRMLRSGVPVVKPRIRANKQPSLRNIASQIDDLSRLSDCRLSSDQHHIDFQYFSKRLDLPKLNQSMSISNDHTLERHNSLFDIESNSNHSNVDENPIPLPPRDRSKTLQSKSSLLRHQRKHPLIIPGNGISRTLAKISTCSMGDQVDGKLGSLAESNSKGIVVQNQMSNSPDEFEQRIESELTALDSLPTGNNLFTPDLLDFSDNSVESEIEDNKLEKLGSSTIGMKSHYPMIINSLHSDQLDVEISNSEIIQVPTMYSNNIKSNQKSLQSAEFFETSNNSGISINRSRINAGIASDDIILQQKSIADGHNSNFVKNLRISGTQIQNNELSRHSDHVSCEDLLEFACDGPNIHRTRGPHNGEQSDEVRIMLKVLHGYSTPESCVAALNKTDWNILAAIKMERLQDLLKKENNFVSLEDCKLMLNQCNGDVVKAASLLKSVDDTTSV